MPQRGLPSVEISFTGDTRHIFDQMEKMADLFERIDGMVGRLQQSSDRLATGSLPRMRDAASAMDQLAGGDLARQFREQLDAIRAQEDALGDMGSKARQAREAQDDVAEGSQLVTGALLDEAHAADELRTKYANLGSAAGRVTQEQERMIR